jgi:hypothetical protein
MGDIHFDKVTVMMDESFIDSLFEKYTDSGEILMEIYYYVLPQLREGFKMSGEFPKVNVETSKTLFKKFIAFDKRVGAPFMAGGNWFNSGFGSTEEVELKDWEVSLDGVILTPID